MREIKFRTPTKCQNGHFRWYYYDVYFGEVGSIKWGNKEKDCKCSTDGLDKGFEKIGDDEQFIGLLDKKGKEIYEGDIVHYSSDMRELKGEVIYDNEAGAFKIDNNHFTWFNENAAEIIGNIYQNKELINA